MKAFTVNVFKIATYQTTLKSPPALPYCSVSDQL